MEENKRTIEDKLYIAFSALDEDVARYYFCPVIYISLVAFARNAASYSDIIKMTGRTSDQSVLSI